MFTDMFVAVFNVIMSVWGFFTCFNVPGTSFTPAQWFIGLFVVCFAIRILSQLTGGTGGGSGYRGADTTRNAKISETRKNDKF